LLNYVGNDYMIDGRGISDEFKGKTTMRAGFLSNVVGGAYSLFR